jgi:hypothetical protein
MAAFLCPVEGERCTHFRLRDPYIPVVDGGVGEVNLLKAPLLLLMQQHRGKADRPNVVLTLAGVGERCRRIENDQHQLAVDIHLVRSLAHGLEIA